VKKEIENVTCKLGAGNMILFWEDKLIRDIILKENKIQEFMLTLIKRMPKLKMQVHRKRARGSGVLVEERGSLNGKSL